MVHGLKKRLRITYATFVVAVAAFALAVDYLWRAPALAYKIAVGVAAMMVAGMALQRGIGLRGGFGLYTIGGKMGLATIDKVSRRRKDLWRFMVAWGLTLGFGLAAYRFAKRRKQMRAYALGLASIAFLMVFIFPYIADAFQLISLPALQNAAAKGSSRAASPIAYAMLSVTIAAGFSGYTFAAILYNAGSILVSMALFVAGAGASSGIAQQVPGIAPLIPGLDIPFFAGIIALAVILSIHELSHGVIARIFKVRLKSIGMMMFGIIPVGAFVEPDDRGLKRLSAQKRTDVFAAGISANFCATFVFFVLVFLVSEFVVPHAYTYGVVITGVTKGYPAYGTLQGGMQIVSWDGHAIANMSSLSLAAANDTPGKTVVVGTRNGTFAFVPVASSSNLSRGIIGVTIGYEPLLFTPLSNAVHFIFQVLALSLLLNFLVAVVNLLPLPGFDGWHIYKSNLKDHRLVNALAALVVVSLVLNAVPWAFYV